MDLLRLLEIDRSLIPPEAQRSLLIAEMTWSGCRLAPGPRRPLRLARKNAAILHLARHLVRSGPVAT